MSVSEAAPSDVIEGTAVDIYRPHADPTLFHTDDPVEVIEKATRAADALKKVVASRGLIAKIKGKEHPQVEAWQTLGSMVGVFPVRPRIRQEPWPSPIPESLKNQHDRGLAFGFTASFEAQRADGAVVGGAEASCMRTESRWADADDYAVKSMAQTRATSKTLATPLRFVMTLAGYEGTPAEEVPDGKPTQSEQPFGPAYDHATIGPLTAAACVKLAGGKDLGIALFKTVAKDCGGYMPQAAALALIHAAEGGNRVPDVEAPELT